MFVSRGSKPTFTMWRAVQWEAKGYMKNSPAAEAESEKQNDKHFYYTKQYIKCKLIHSYQGITYLLISTLGHSLRSWICKTVTAQMKIQVRKCMHFTRTALFSHNSEYCKDFGFYSAVKKTLQGFEQRSNNKLTPFDRLTLPAVLRTDCG